MALAIFFTLQLFLRLRCVFPRRFASLHATDAKDVGWLNARPQRDVVAIPPHVLRAAQQVFCNEAPICGNADLVEVKIRPAGLFIKGVDVDHDQNCIVEARRRL